jgi:hypothetical protein
VLKRLAILVIFACPPKYRFWNEVPVAAVRWKALRNQPTGGPHSHHDPNLVLSRLAFPLSLVFFIPSTVTSHLWQLLYLRRCPSRFSSRAIYSELSLIDGRISFSLTNQGIFPPHHFHEYTQPRVIEYLQPSTLLYYQQLIHFQHDGHGYRNGY